MQQIAMTLSLQRPSTWDSGRPWSFDDYEIIAAGMVIGRVVKGVGPSNEIIWRWHLHAISGRDAVVQESGAEPDCELAWAAANKSWNRWLAMMRPREPVRATQPSGNRGQKAPAQTPRKHLRATIIEREGPRAPLAGRPPTGKGARERRTRS